MPFSLVPEILDAIDMVMAVGDYLRIVNGEVVEFWHIQNVVASPAVLIYDAVQGITLRLMIGIKVAPEASGIILV